METKSNNGLGRRYKLKIYFNRKEAREELTLWSFEAEECKGLRAVAHGMQERILKKQLNNKYQTAILYDTSIDKQVAKWSNGIRQF